MRFLSFYIIIIVSLSMYVPVNGQVDIDPPVTPLLTQVSVQPETGRVVLNWNQSPSTDVAGYVVYNFRNGEGFALDTIRNQGIVTYLYTGSFSSYFSEAFVIAAYDSSGNISPLSNELSTVYTTTQIDTCKKEIKISWSKYKDIPRAVTGYKILFSINGGVFNEAGTTLPSVNYLTIESFESDAQYCFEVVALLEGNYSSLSNKSCIQTGVQKAPDWINADFASVDGQNEIKLSFSVDPLSEITNYRLERRSENEENFSLLSLIESAGKTILYTDKTADPDKKNYYRLLAVNNCGNPVVSSNLSGNIITSIEKNGNLYNLKWNSYNLWRGLVSAYTIYVNEGGGFRSHAVVSPSDSVYSFSYESFMFDISAGSICFYISASETGNPYGISGITSSSAICTETVENINVPNAFTPNNDLRNDIFRPVLSFTPADYHLIITDRKNSILFESKDFMTGWDGNRNGSAISEGVYLWYLKLRTPSGNQLSRTGTVTIIR